MKCADHYIPSINNTCEIVRSGDTATVFNDCGTLLFEVGAEWTNEQILQTVEFANKAYQAGIHHGRIEDILKTSDDDILAEVRENGLDPKSEADKIRCLFEETEKEVQLTKAIEHAINSHSAENGSNTPDFVLAKYLTGCLAVFDKATQDREQWYGRGQKQIPLKHLLIRAQRYLVWLNTKAPSSFNMDVETYDFLKVLPKLIKQIDEALQ